MDESVLYIDDEGDWRWTRTAPNGEVVGASTEGYVNKADAEDNYYRTNGSDAPALVLSV